jgi:hypothetical protein
MNTTPPRPPTTSSLRLQDHRPNRRESHRKLPGCSEMGTRASTGMRHSNIVNLAPVCDSGSRSRIPDLTRTDHLAPDCHIDGVPPALFGSGLSAAIQSAMPVTCVLRLPRQRNSTIQRRSRADLITHLRFPCVVPERARLRGSSVFRRLERNVHARAQSGL